MPCILFPRESINTESGVSRAQTASAEWLLIRCSNCKTTSIGLTGGTASSMVAKYTSENCTPEMFFVVGDQKCFRILRNWADLASRLTKAGLLPDEPQLIQRIVAQADTERRPTSWRT